MSQNYPPSESDKRAPQAHLGQPRKRIRPLHYVLLFAFLALLGIWWYSHRENAVRGTGGTTSGGHRHFGFGANGMAQPVVAQAAEKADLDTYINGLGTVTPLANITLRTQVTGQLMQFNFKEGQTVTKGDVLAVIDPRPYQVALEQAQGQILQAQSQLKEAETDLARYTTLSQQDSIAKQQVDAQQALVNQYKGLVQTDQAAIDTAKLNLSYCHIEAPVSGRLGLRQVDPGNYVTPGDANGLVVLTQIKPISVLFPLPEDNVPQIAARLKSGAILPVDAYDRTMSHKLASGVLDTIDNQIDTSTGSFRLRATFANDDESLFPNQFVNVRLLVDTIRGALVIPTSSIERGQQGTYVYVVKADNTVTARPVVLGPTEGERVAVTSGLSEGEKVVTDGADKLKEGTSVIVQEPGANPATAAAPQEGTAAPHKKKKKSGDASAPKD